MYQAAQQAAPEGTYPSLANPEPSARAEEARATLATRKLAAKTIEHLHLHSPRPFAIGPEIELFVNLKSITLAPNDISLRKEQQAFLAIYKILQQPTTNRPTATIPLTDIDPSLPPEEQYDRAVASMTLCPKNIRETATELSLNGKGYTDPGTWEWVPREIEITCLPMRIWPLLPNLTRLRMPNCNIRSLNLIFPEQLKELNLDGCEIESADGAQLPASLEVLSLNKTNLGPEIDSLYPCLPASLLKLALDWCNIESIDTKKLPQRLEYLSLQNNTLTQFDGTLPVLVTLHLGGNPLESFHFQIPETLLTLGGASQFLDQRDDLPRAIANQGASVLFLYFADHLPQYTHRFLRHPYRVIYEALSAAWLHRSG